MIDATYGQNILKGIVKGASVTFPTPYLGLLAVMPGGDGSGGTEVSYPEYTRVALNVNGLEGKPIMAAPTSEIITEDDEHGNSESKTASSVVNQELIYWPENETGSVCTAVGVGFFAAREASAASKPYKWKQFLDENGKPKPMTINVNSSPMFRIGKLNLKVK